MPLTPEQRKVAVDFSKASDASHKERRGGGISEFGIKHLLVVAFAFAALIPAVLIKLGNSFNSAGQSRAESIENFSRSLEGRQKQPEAEEPFVMPEFVQVPAEVKWDRIVWEKVARKDLPVLGKFTQKAVAEKPVEAIAK